MLPGRKTRITPRLPPPCYRGRSYRSHPSRRRQGRPYGRPILQRCLRCSTHSGNASFSFLFREFPEAAAAAPGPDHRCLDETARGATSSACPCRHTCCTERRWPGVHRSRLCLFCTANSCIARNRRESFPQLSPPSKRGIRARLLRVHRARRKRESAARKAANPI